MAAAVTVTLVELSVTVLAIGFAENFCTLPLLEL